MYRPIGVEGNQCERLYIALVVNRHRHLFWSTSVKATPEAVRILNETFNQAVLGSSHLATLNGINTVMCMQPISVGWQKAARDLGGDAIDLDPANGTFLGMFDPDNRR
jgi:hypothetical protein